MKWIFKKSTGHTRMSRERVVPKIMVYFSAVPSQLKYLVVEPKASAVKNLPEFS